ncbi:MAG: hypothetical protein JWM98_529 [Thermoleophilia bacterium]|nr:hypothetical protein [Thermoleophilia bacterium]
MRRILLFALIAFASLIAAGCGQFGKQYKPTGADSSSSAQSQTEEARVSNEKFTDEVKKRDGCTGPDEFESEGSTHTGDPNKKVDYKHNPPHSGDHYDIPAEWGIYDKQQADVATTHNLEHGHIVISYKGLSDKEVDKLRSQVKKNDYHLVLQPRKPDPKNGVYYMAWTTQLYCKKPSAAGLQYMIDNYRDQGPELFTEDTGGGAMGAGKKPS